MRIVLNLETGESFSMKSIKMEFYGCSGIGSYFNDLYSLL